MQQGESYDLDSNRKDEEDAEQIYEKTLRSLRLCGVYYFVPLNMTTNPVFRDIVTLATNIENRLNDEPDTHCQQEEPVQAFDCF